jgi:uridine phosphorylase
MEPTLPTTSEFYLDGEPHISPARLIAEFCSAEGVTAEELGVRPTVIVTFGTRLIRFLADKAGARKTEHRLPISWGELHSTDNLCLVRLLIGAPAAVTACEELIAVGARTFVVVAASGGLQPRLPIGSVILPERAIREEGTSHHYLPPEAPALASSSLVDELEQACLGRELRPERGLHWTTDAIYREHLQKIERYAGQGVLSVDMELSALFTLAECRGVQCAGIVVISDELFEPFRVGFRMPEFVNSLGDAGLAALDVARRLGAEASD